MLVFRKSELTFLRLMDMPALSLAIFPDFTNIPKLSFKLLSFLVELKFYVFVGNKFSCNKLKLIKLQLEREC